MKTAFDILDDHNNYTFENTAQALELDLNAFQPLRLDVLCHATANATQEQLYVLRKTIDDAIGLYEDERNCPRDDKVLSNYRTASQTLAERITPALDLDKVFVERYNRTSVHLNLD